MFDRRGSTWRKWDLHVHTPDSLVHHYAGSDPWDAFLEALRNLPTEIKVLGINDYLFLDGYRKVLAEKQAGRLQNLDLILPVIELRLDKFGGSKSSLSRVNFHVIFSDELSADIIESQFLNALSAKYTLSPQYDSLRTSGAWAAVPTRASLVDLGRKIIDSVPEAERSKFHSPLIEGFNNLCLSLESIKEILARPYFDGKVLTAVGKAEWADIKWSDQSIADKKTIINGADIVFVAAESPEAWKTAHKGLVAGGVNAQLLDCSDAHHYYDSDQKDRLGHCYTWIKSDPTFEGLRQAVLEYQNRVQISNEAPLEPVLQLKRVSLDFPLMTRLSGNEEWDDFCFRGKHTISFSPYLTCIVGGRGTGKSTLLNLIHERLESGSTEFFEKNGLQPAEAAINRCVDIEGISDAKSIEFLQQNEVEQFASDHKRLTDAVFTRLKKLSGRDRLSAAEKTVEDEIVAMQGQLKRVKSFYDLLKEQTAAEADLATQQSIVESLQSDVYSALSDNLGKRVKDLQALVSGKERLELLQAALSEALREWSTSLEGALDGDTVYDAHARETAAAIDLLIRQASESPAILEANARAIDLEIEVKEHRSRLTEFLTARGLSEENLSDIGRANESIARLASQVSSLKSRVGRLKAEIEKFESRTTVDSEYQHAVESLLVPVNEDLKGQGDEVKPIELRYSFDITAFKMEAIQNVVRALGTIEGRSARIDYVERQLEDIDWTALGTQAEALKRLRDDNTVYARAVREFMSDERNFAVLGLEVALARLDVRSFGKIDVLYDDRPVEQSSFGQRCTAVIVVLLLLGNTPIVIDEPEAHLDSSLIAKYLVNLVKRRKQHRQIVFATHNANFVINGDADLIHSMSMDDSKTTKVVSTTIEDLQHRPLLLALEGGKAAFQRRERRYGIE